VFASAAYSKTEYIDFISSLGDFSGNEFAYAPKVTAALGINYAGINGLFGNLNMTYKGESYSDQANTRKLDAHSLINLNTGYEMQPAKAEFYATSLFNEQYETARYSALGGRMGRPREYDVRLSYGFR